MIVHSWCWGYIEEADRAIDEATLERKDLIWAVLCKGGSIEAIVLAQQEVEFDQVSSASDPDIDDIVAGGAPSQPR